jgi:uncharacterized protein (DUF2267 family)
VSLQGRLDVNREKFIAAVAARAHVSPDQAENLACATLQTLAERIDAGEVEHVAAQLPAGIGQWLQTAPRTDRFSVDEFVSRVTRRAGTEPDQARDGIPAVFMTIREAISGKEFRDVLAQLPKDFWPLLEPVRAP